MIQQRGPHNSGKCPFHIDPASPLSAEKSIDRCVACVTCGNQRLQSLKEDFRQIAYQTILEERPKYDPTHPSGASFITFIRSRVCGKLRDQRKKHLKSLPFPVLEESSRLESQSYWGDAPQPPNNPLVDGLVADARQCEGVSEQVVRRVEVEQFERLLPQLLERLSKQERRTLKLKFFEGFTTVEIAEVLGVTKGRVSQINNAALAKLKRAYLYSSSEAMV